MEITITWDEAEDETVMPFMARGFVVQLSMIDGIERDVVAHYISRDTDDGSAVFVVEPFDRDAEQGTGTKERVPLDDVRAVHVY